MRYPEKETWHPSQTLLGESPNVWQARDIVQVGHPIATDFIDLGLRYVVHLRENHHGLYETYQDGSGRFATRLQQRAADISRDLVREAVPFLQLNQIYARARLELEKKQIGQSNLRPCLREI